MNRLSDHIIKQAKAVSIIGYLEAKGVYPVHQSNENRYQYFSPFRKERSPSMWVDRQLNIWNDLGGTGGDVIKLCSLLEPCNFPEAVRRLNSQSFSFKQPENLEMKVATGNGLELRKVKDLENKALIEYLRSRHISFELGKRYLKEAYYMKEGKQYFALAFPNHEGGYEIRNPYFKSCFAPKSPSFIKGSGPGNTLNIFEGFFDFLSYLEYNNLQTPKQNTVILNGTANLSYLKENWLSKFERVYAYLDRDKGGKQALVNLNQLHKTVIDCSFYYDGFKDFNEFITNSGN